MISLVSYKATSLMTAMVMILQVCRVRFQKFKVFQPVVQSVTVDVMHDFLPLQLPTKVLLHHDSVLQRSLSSFSKHHPVAGIVDGSRTERGILPNGRVTVSLPHAPMISAIAAGYMCFPATFNRTNP